MELAADTSKKTDLIGPDSKLNRRPVILTGISEDKGIFKPVASGNTNAGVNFFTGNRNIASVSTSTSPVMSLSALNKLVNFEDKFLRSFGLSSGSYACM